MAEVQCFLLEETIKIRRYLRRFVFKDHEAGPCADGHYHNARNVLDEVEWPGPGPVSGDLWPHTDPMWPTECQWCGYVFTDENTWQIGWGRLYSHPSTGLIVADEAPAGAMWFESWRHDLDIWCGPDGKSLAVKLPDGIVWNVDGPSRNSNSPWTRTGTAPLITASPSIQSPGYHGHLVNGVLISC